MRIFYLPQSLAFVARVQKFQLNLLTAVQNQNKRSFNNFSSDIEKVKIDDIEKVKIDDK